MKPSRNGSSILEFTLAGIPLVFVLISTVEMARGMWVYHTLAYAIKEGTRFAIVHGQDCVTDPNNCPVRISDVAAQIQWAGVGLDANVLQLTFASSTRSVPSSGSQSLQTSLSDNTYWPTNAKGQAVDAGANTGLPLTITGTYLYRSAISLFWPGAGKGVAFGAYNLIATSTERIEF